MRLLPIPIRPRQDVSASLVTLQHVLAHEGEALATLRVEAMRESLEQAGRFHPEHARERFLSGFSPQHTRHVLLGAEKVGFVVLRPVELGLLLDHLYILPRHQWKGIGSAVLATVLAEADRQAKPVRVGALKQSRSNAFYVSHGFKLVDHDEWDNYYVRHPKCEV